MKEDLRKELATKLEIISAEDKIQKLFDNFEDLSHDVNREQKKMKEI